VIYRIEISEQADADLRGIFEYIAFDLESMQNAKGQLNRLEESITGLEHMPKRFRKYVKEPWHSRGLRIMPVDNYCVFYIPNEQNGVASIIRVMYGGRDIDTELQEHTKI
jgi:toxin ParE1/3/4